MAISAIVHIHGEDAILAELDSVPNPTHQFLLMRNIRKKDGKPLAYVADEAEVFLFAWHKITFVEILQDIHLQDSATPTVGAAGAAATAANGQKPVGTTVLGFFRDDET
jgi:hypothetical protein